MLDEQKPQVLVDYRWTLLSALAVGLILAGLALFFVGELLVAGLCLLAASLTIYARGSNV